MGIYIITNFERSRELYIYIARLLKGNPEKECHLANDGISYPCLHMDKKRQEKGKGRAPKVSEVSTSHDARDWE